MCDALLTDALVAAWYQGVRLRAVHADDAFVCRAAGRDLTTRLCRCRSNLATDGGGRRNWLGCMCLLRAGSTTYDIILCLATS